MRVWDGSSPTRKDIGHEKAPDHADWVAMFYALKETQELILNVLKTSDNLPDIPRQIAEFQKLLVTLKTEVVDIPEYGPRIERIEKRLLEYGNAYDIADRLKASMEVIQNRITQLDSQISQIDIQGTQNRRQLEALVQRELSRLKLAMQEQLDSQNNRIKALEKLT